MISGLGTILTVIGVVVVALPLVVGGVFVILIVANRADPDPTGRRPVMVYSYAISFIALFVTLFATFAIVVNLVSLIGSHHSSPSLGDLGGASGSFQIVTGQSGSQHPVGDAAARGIVMGALLAAVAGFAYLAHVRSADRATSGVPAVEPTGRVRSSYIAAVSFVCVVILIVSVVVATYQIFRIIGPGVFSSGGSGSRIGALRTMLPLVYLAAASAWLLRRHLRQVPPDSRPLLARPGSGRPGTTADTPADSAPIPVEVEVLEAAPPPRKRAPRRQPPAKS